MEPKKDLKKKIKQELISCFIHAQKKNLDILIGSNPSLKQKMDYAEKFVITAFKETGGDYENPSKAGFRKAVKWMIKTAPPAQDCETTKNHRLKIFDMIESMEK